MQCRKSILPRVQEALALILSIMRQKEQKHMLMEELPRPVEFE